MQSPHAVLGTSQTRPRATAFEWPTLVLIGACYAAMLAALALASHYGVAALAPLGALSVALHASLQHEAIHGHPTRSAALNEALVFPSLALLFPYRRFKETHLRHHRDERLTDPYEDPESWYRAEGDLAAASPALRRVLGWNATLAGRFVLGPWLSAWGLWRADWRRGGPRIRDAYLRHAAGVSIVLGVAWFGFGVDPLSYLLFAAWPGVALLMLRTFAEHRAAEAVGERTAIVEAEAPFALLFLNNNLHAVHHAHPRAPWYRLPGLYRRDRASYHEANGGYVLRGYREILRRWFWRAKEPVAHPLMRRQTD